MRHHVGMGGPGSTPYSYVAFTFAYYHFHMLIPMGKKLRDVTTIGMASGDLSGIDYLYVVQQLNRLIKASIEETPMKEYYNVDRNIQKCKEMNLYILKDFVKEKEQSKIGEYYKNSFELVDFKTYEDAILNKTKGVAYTKIIWANQLKMYAWVVVNAENGETLSLLTFGGVKFGRSHEANDIIKVNHFKYIEFKGGQNFNNKYK